MPDPNASFLKNLGSNEFSKMWAQMIAFAPVMFQLAKSLRDLGVIRHLASEAQGLTMEDLCQRTDLSPYSLSVILDGGESCGLIRVEGGRFFPTEAALYLENDSLTRVNMDFTHDVCYQGLFHLQESLQRRIPAGLKVFGEWATIYEGLTQLPPQTLKSWLEFDHFYSDDAFPRVLNYIFKEKIRKILDVGGNTGKFARACARFEPEVHVTILDYPQQLALAEAETRKVGLEKQIQFQPQKLLDHSVPFPKGFDVIWMSQFLDCFGEDDIVSLLKRARASMEESSVLMIMEPFTDKQKFETAKFCLDMTSLYFTCLANGQSRMYRASDFYRFLDLAGLEVVEEVSIRLSQTILKCRKKSL